MPTLERNLFGVGELRRSVAVFRDLLHAHQARIDQLNVYPIADRDTGTNMARTLDAVVGELDATPAELAATCDAVSRGSLMGARGNSGIILAQVLRGLAGTLRDSTVLGPASIAEALRAASDAAYQAVVEPVEGTILTVVRVSADGAADASASGADLAEVVRAARDAGRAALDETPDLLPVLAAAGVVDAGGAGYLLLLDALLHVVANAPLPEAGSVRPALPDGVMGEQRYEVMFICHLDDASIGSLKARWSEIGDSIVVGGGGGQWNCHVHTNDVDAAIEAAADLGGRPQELRVTDLFAPG